jgi:hypothetical protein
MRGRAWLFAASFVLSLCTASAQAKPGLPELRGEALARLRATDAAKASLIGLAALPPAQDAAAEYLADLFQDEGFIAVTRAWLDRSQATSTDGVYLEWARHYEATISAGVALLDDEDLATLARLTLLRWLDATGQSCARLMAATRVGQLEGLPPYAAGELSDYFRILKRAYLGALANEKPRPLASDEQLARAALEMMATVSKEQRGRLVQLVTAFPDVVTPEVCIDLNTLVTAMARVPGEDGAAMRREFNLNIVRETFDPEPRRDAATAEVSGTSADGMFEPGAVQLHYPPAAAAASVQGTMVMQIWVDGQGYAQRVKTAKHDFKPATVTLHDGSEVPSHELFEPVVIAFYQSGRFQRRFKDGKPQPYLAEVPMDWTLK